MTGKRRFALGAVVMLAGLAIVPILGLEPGLAAPRAPGCGSTTATFSNSTPVAINDLSVITSTIAVSGIGRVVDVNVQTFITHTFPGDLDMTLESPAGTVVTLSTDNGGGNDNVFDGTIWDDTANPGGQVPYISNNGLATDHGYVNLTLASPLAPEEPLGAFAGEDPNGTWTLTISDDAGGDTGSLNSWSLDVATGSCGTGGGGTSTLEVVRVGTGSGKVTSVPAGINCPPDCTEVTGGGHFTLTATPDSGSVFAGWAGNCSGTSTCSLTVSSDTLAVARFDLSPSPSPSPSPTPPPAPGTFNLNASKVGKGRIVDDSASLNCGKACTAAFDEGTIVTLTATPHAGWHLKRWRFGCEGNDPVCTLEMSSNRRAEAVFVKD